MIVSKTTASLCQYLRDMSNDILINIIPKLFRIIQMQDEKKKKRKKEKLLLLVIQMMLR